MKKLLFVVILTGVVFLLLQCSKHSTPPDDPTPTNAIVFETDESATSTYAGSSAFWVEYSCTDSTSGGGCNSRTLKIGDVDGTMYEVFFDSNDSLGITDPILLSGSRYDLTAQIKSSQTGKHGNSGTEGKRFLTLTIQPTQIPRLPYPPCFSTTTLSQSPATRHYTLDSTRVSRDDLLAWITYRSGTAAPVFSLVAWFPGVASTGDTTECYLRFSASDTTGPLVKARLGFNLAPLASVIAQKTPCQCMSTLRVLRPQNNWHSGFEVAEFERTAEILDAAAQDYYRPLADGNYWVYSGFCPPMGKATTDYEVGESVSVEILPQETCMKLYRIRSSHGPYDPYVVANCGGQIYVGGKAWQPPVPTEYFSHTVPAGTFDSCYSRYSIFWSNGYNVWIYAKGVGVIEQGQTWFSVRSGDSYFCRSQLLRYRVASE